ncbi:MAG: hypothetical protein AAF383_29410 [Cyanobacteria bacterium P01_A01_bin.83]
MLFVGNQQDRTASPRRLTALDKGTRNEVSPVVEDDDLGIRPVPHVHAPKQLTVNNDYLSNKQQFSEIYNDS